MGISGLLKALKENTEEVHISKFRGKRAGIDGYAWLHRAVYSCAYELSVGLETQAYLKYFLDRVQILTDAGVVPVVVFDGADLPLKEGTNVGRHAKRAECKERAKKCLESGDRLKAMDLYANSYDVTPELAITVIRVLRHNDVQVVLAPYEADAQLAYLSHRHLIDVVITEDSDLVAHCVANVFTKMDATGTGQLLAHSIVVPPDLNADAFLEACVLAGCDYLPSLRGIGIKKAFKLRAQFPDIEAILAHLSVDYPAPVLAEYLTGYRNALYAFRHQCVIDPSGNTLEHLHPPVVVPPTPPHLLIGTPWDPSLVARIASFETDPTTLQPYIGTYNCNMKNYKNLRLRKKTGPNLAQGSLLGHLVRKPRVMEEHVKEEKKESEDKVNSSGPSTVHKKRPASSSKAPAAVVKVESSKRSTACVVRSRFFFYCTEEPKAEEDGEPVYKVRRLSPDKESDGVVRARLELMAETMPTDNRDTIAAYVASEEYTTEEEEEDNEEEEEVVCIEEGSEASQSAPASEEQSIEAEVKMRQLLVPCMKPVGAQGISRAKERETKGTFNTMDGEIKKFTFPADLDFWGNFVDAVRDAPQPPPLFVVSPSHSNEKLKVNQQFMRGYVKEWEEANPHTVTVQGSDGEITFHASHTFWEKVQKMKRADPNNPNAIAVQSNLDGTPVHTTPDEWNDACKQWEAEQGVGRYKKGTSQGVVKSSEGSQVKPTALLRDGRMSFNTTPSPPQPQRHQRHHHHHHHHYHQHHHPPQPVAAPSFAQPRLPANIPPLPQNAGEGFWAYGVLHYHVHNH